MLWGAWDVVDASMTAYYKLSREHASQSIFGECMEKIRHREEKLKERKKWKRIAKTFPSTAHISIYIATYIDTATVTTSIFE